MSRRACVVLLALAASACGPGSYGEVRDELVEATCAWARRCGYVGATERAACPVDTILEIFHDTAEERAEPHAIDIGGSIDEGRMRYDSVNAGDCRDAVAQASCDPALAARQRRAACNAVVAPHTETDRTCWSDHECTGGICVRQPGCAGACVAYASPGAPCEGGALTPQAARCDPTVAFCGPMSAGDPPTCQRKKQRDVACTDTVECAFNYTCRRGLCVPPIEVDEGQACGGIDPCRAGLYCDPETLSCTAQRLRGVLCTSRLGCQDGLACIGLVEVPVGEVPTPVATPGVCADWLDVGAACQDVGLSGCPTASQACENGVCTATELRAGLGESCTTRACQDGMACDSRQRCGWLLATFGRCEAPKESLCAPGLVCGSPDGGTSASGGTCLPAELLACFLDASADN